MQSATQCGHTGFFRSLCCLLLLLPAFLRAQGLGEAVVLSALGDPVEVEIPLQDIEGVDPAELRFGLANRAQYQGFGLEWRPVLDGLRFNLVGPMADGSRRLLITGTEPLLEPYLDLLLSLHWSDGSLLREYVLLFDLPPGRAGQRLTVSPPAASAPQSGDRREYQVRAGEVFWNIAQQFLRAGDSASLHQMLLGLYELNPEAFVNGNISLLRADARLQIPDPVDLLHIDISTAPERFEALWAAGIAALRPPPDFVSLAPPEENSAGSAAPQPPRQRQPGTETGRVLPPGNGWLLPVNTPVVLPLDAALPPGEQEGTLLNVRQRTLETLLSSPRLGMLPLASADDPDLQRLSIQASAMLAALSLQAERRERLLAALAASRVEMEEVLRQTQALSVTLEAALAEAALRQAQVWKQWLGLVLLAGILLCVGSLPWLLRRRGPAAEARSA